MVELFIEGVSTDKKKSAKANTQSNETATNKPKMSISNCHPFYNLICALAQPLPRLHIPPPQIQMLSSEESLAEQPDQSQDVVGTHLIWRDLYQLLIR